MEINETESGGRTIRVEKAGEGGGKGKDGKGEDGKDSKCKGQDKGKGKKGKVDGGARSKRDGSMVESTGMNSQPKRRIRRISEKNNDPAREGEINNDNDEDKDEKPAKKKKAAAEEGDEQPAKKDFAECSEKGNIYIYILYIYYI